MQDVYYRHVSFVTLAFLSLQNTKECTVSHYSSRLFRRQMSEGS
jgi:hypothetical protein